MLTNTTRKVLPPLVVVNKGQDDNTKAAGIESERSMESNSKPTCRICWGAEELEEENFNPLISPCNCIGTISSIHLKCLKGWLETKRSMKIHRGQVVIKFKKLDCELCKQVFPFQIAHNNRLVDIVDIDKPANDYIVFESINSAAVP